MALAAIGLFLLAYQWGNQYRYSGGPPTISGVLIRPAQPLPDFLLRDSAGEPVGRGDLLEHWSLLAFASLSDAGGHRGIARLVEVYNRLADRRDLRKRLRLLVITADAAPPLVRDFERLSPAIAVLTGLRDAVADVAAALGAEPDAALNGSADEPPTLFLLDPNAELVALFPGAQLPAAVAEDVAALARYQRRTGDDHTD
jgi:cytochrome oxidase Cu insertion factor (SCO1/SenC/PrrC family)